VYRSISLLHHLSPLQYTTSGLKPGFHSNARNARKALRKEKYASKIKSAQETQQTQENYASEKQKYASASHATVLAQENATIESILFFTQRTHRTQRKRLRCLRLNRNRALGYTPTIAI